MKEKELNDKLKKAEETIKSFRESLDLCLGEYSPLPEMTKDIIRGFFIDNIKKDIMR